MILADMEGHIHLESKIVRQVTIKAGILVIQKTEELLCFGEVPSGCNDGSGENESAKSHLTWDPSFWA